jgi:hypothetical protein
MKADELMISAQDSRGRSRSPLTLCGIYRDRIAYRGGCDPCCAYLEELLRRIIDAISSLAAHESHARAEYVSHQLFSAVAQSSSLAPKLKTMHFSLINRFMLSAVK